MNKLLILFSVLISLLSCQTKNVIVTNSEKIERVIHMDIDKIEVINESVLIHLHFHSDTFNLPDSASIYELSSITYFQAVSDDSESISEPYNAADFQISDSINTKRGIIMNISILLNQNNCKNGKFSLKRIIDIPLRNLSTEYTYQLKTSFRHHKTMELVTVSGRPSFTLVNAEKREINQFLAVDYGEAKGLAKEIEIPLYLFTGKSSESTEIYIYFEQNGKYCSSRYTLQRNMGLWESAGENLTFRIPYVDLYISPGEKQLNYMVYGKKDNKTPQILTTGTIAITQPQFYFLAFENKNVDIDVTGLDSKSTTGMLFTKKSGRGLGDAFYVLYRDGKSLYESKMASNSGSIPSQKGWIQMGLEDVLELKILDYDEFNKHDLIIEYPIPQLQEGNHTVQIKDEGRVKRFDFSYSLNPITDTTFEKINKTIKK